MLLLAAGLGVGAGGAPFHVAGLPAGVGASPLGAGLVVGLTAGAAGTVAIKPVTALIPIPAIFMMFAAVPAALARGCCGAAAPALPSPRPPPPFPAEGPLRSG